MALYEKDNYEFAKNSETEIIHMENQKDKKNKFYEKGGWLFTSYPVIMDFLYVVLGACFGNAGWITGWLVFLTISNDDLSYAWILCRALAPDVDNIFNNPYLLLCLCSNKKELSQTMRSLFSA